MEHLHRLTTSRLALYGNDFITKRVLQDVSPVVLRTIAASYCR